MKRVWVIGNTGSGKSTLAAALAARLGVPHIELDALHWGPNWTPNKDFQARVEAALQQPGWVVDGNYGVVREQVWARADTVVWLDYSFGTVFRQLSRRTLRRITTREILWGGNQETWAAQFASRHSIFWWVFKTHWRKRREYTALMHSPAWAHLEVARLRSPAAMKRWLAGVMP